MILKVKDELKSLRRTDPDCEAYRDLIGLYSPSLSMNKKLVPIRYPAALRRSSSF